MGAFHFTVFCNHIRLLRLLPKHNNLSFPLLEAERIADAYSLLDKMLHSAVLSDWRAVWGFEARKVVVSDKFVVNSCSFVCYESFHSNMPQFTEEEVLSNQALLALLDRIAQEKKASPGQISLAWMLAANHILCQSQGHTKQQGCRKTWHRRISP